jgi:Ran GTPase-activating protein (RanGAP) involved in mRNA processing and transport
LENVEGIKRMKFLETLLIGGNRLRDLDKFLLFLKKFAFLKQVDLFGNPISEEPEYRLKLIYYMPQLEVLDRHPITPKERI